MNFALLAAAVAATVAITVVVTLALTQRRYKRRFRAMYQKADLQRMNAVYAPPPRQRLHVYTVATERTPGLEALAASCHRRGLGLHILGLGNLWQGFGNKYLWTAEYLALQQLPDDDVMVFVDAYDVLALADETEILAKFEATGARIVYTAEKVCYPDADLAERFPPSATPFRFLNSGGAVGRVGDMRAMIAAIGFGTTDDDQRGVTRYFLDHPGAIALDTRCAFFLPLFAVTDDELALDASEGRVTLLATGERPCFLHGNGPSVKYLGELGQRIGVLPAAAA